MTMMHRDSPLLTIVIPAYNVEAYIEQCVTSLTANISSDHAPLIEVIVVNDGSTDRTQPILNLLRQRYDITLIDSPNRGVGAARNLGLKEASGRYIYFVDSDDYVIAGALDQIIVELLQSPNIDIWEIENIEIDLDGKFLYDCNENFCPQDGHGESVYAAWEEKGIFRHLTWTKIVARQMLIQNNLFFYEGIVHEDEEWTAKIFGYAQSVRFIPLKLYAYRNRNGSIMHTITFKNVSDLFKVFDSLNLFIQTGSFIPEYRNAVKKHMYEIYMGIASSINSWDNAERTFLHKELTDRFWIMDYAGSFKHSKFYKYAIKTLGLPLFIKLKNLNH
ncbi:MAG: glycosyltransferase [Cloacibacillus sp.]